MKRLTVVVTVCLLLTSFVNAQKKSTSKKQSNGSSHKGAPKSSPSAELRIPKLPKMPKPKEFKSDIQLTPEQQSGVIGPWRPAPKPDPWVAVAPEKASTPTAQVARAQGQKTVRSVKTASLYVRTDPNSFFVDTLKKDDLFRVRAVRRKNGKCDYFGDAIGSLNLKKVWVGCRGLDTKGLPEPRAALPGEFHKSGKKASPSVTTTREYLRDRFGAKLLPETKAGSNGRLRVMPELLDHFDPDPSLNKIQVFPRRNPSTGELYGPVRTVDFSSKTGETIHARYIVKGGNILAVNVRKPGQKNGEGTWGFTNLDNRVRLVKPGNK